MPFIITYPPKELQFLGKFYNPTDLYLFIKNLAVTHPEKTLNRDTYLNMKMKDYTFEDSYHDFNKTFNIEKQLTLLL